jgi:uncharacterized protein (DUF2235 family)
MAKNIVFCADGTWNGPRERDQDDKGATPTNVFKLFLNLSGADSPENLRLANEQERTQRGVNGEALQVAKYLHGVGDSDNFLVKFLGGTLGAGLITRVIRGYTFVSRNYDANDRIFLVGFSRGAYTVRTLAGMIAARGLLDRTRLDLDDKEAAYRLGAAVWYDYRREAPAKKEWLGLLQRLVIDLPAFVSQPPPRERIPAQIEAVAVWDTVGSLGIPIYADRDGQSSRIDALQFCNTKLSDKVVHGIHAIAVDERRLDFTPSLWDSDRPGIKQALFPGAHADVGGGYPAAESGLSDAALNWVTQELSLLNVSFTRPAPVLPQPDARGVAHEPWTYPPFDRLPKATRSFAGREDLLRDPSIDTRINAGPVRADPNREPGPYTPANL